MAFACASRYSNGRHFHCSVNSQVPDRDTRCMKQQQASRLFACIGLWSLIWLIFSPAAGAQETTADPSTATAAEISESVWKKLGLREPNPNSPYAKPPQLELLFEDDFSSDSRENYEIAGRDESVIWEPGRLELKNEAIVSRKLEADNWIELELDLEFSELTKSGQKSEVEFSLGPTTEARSFLVLRQNMSSGIVTSELAVYLSAKQHSEIVGVASPTNIWSESMQSRLPDGRWRICFRKGVWQIEMPNASSSRLVDIQVGRAEVKNIQISSFGESLVIKSFRTRFAANVISELRDESQRELEQAEELSQRAVAAWQAGQVSDALHLSREVGQRRLEHLGLYHDATVQALYGLSVYYLMENRYTEGEALLSYLKVVSSQLYPADHPMVASILGELAVASENIGRLTEAEKCFENAVIMLRRFSTTEGKSLANAINNLAVFRKKQAQLIDAELLYQESLETYRRVHQEDHPDIATCLNNLGELQRTLGRLEDAEKNCEESLAMRRRIYPKGHESISNSLNNLGAVCKLRGRLTEAEKYYRDALEMRRQFYTGDHPRIADSLNNLAVTLAELGRLDESRELLSESLVITRKNSPANHPDVLSSISNLATIEQLLGRENEAERLLEEAAKLIRDLPKQNPLTVASILSNLASIRASLGRYSEAEQLHKEALDIKQTVLVGDHTTIAISMSNLGNVQESLGKFEESEANITASLEMSRRQFPNGHPTIAKTICNLSRIRILQRRYLDAETLLDESLSMYRRFVSHDHQDVAVVLASLGRVRQLMGRSADAESLLIESLEMQKRLYPTDHFSTSTTLAYLSEVYEAMGKTAAAVETYDQSVSMGLSILDRSAIFESELQQIHHARTREFQLTGFVSLAVNSQHPAETVFPHCLRWKGVIFARQRLSRLARETGDNEVDTKLLELQSIGAKLARLSLLVPTDSIKQENWRSQLIELQNQRAGLEQDLSSISAEYRALRQQAKIGLQDVLAVIPADAALVDIHLYNRRLETKNEYGIPHVESGYCAFVLRPGREPKLVELGSKPRIDELIGLWRQGYGRSTTSEADPGSALRELLWKPIVTELEGTKTVIVSPEGPLAMLPWGALPGSHPGSYLIEEFAFVTVPVPILLPEMMQVPHVADAAALASMLLVGDVDYGNSTGQSEQVAFSRSAPIGSGGGLRAWAPLDDTRREISAIKDSFELNFLGGHVTVLRRGDATEGALRSIAPAHQFLHIATHGYFAPESMKSALASNSGEQQIVLDNKGPAGPLGYHPGVLSGLVMAGANNEPLPNRDDGIMTALEVGDLDLRKVDCVVLSACSTGLGQVAGGEGILGLQRSFQIAGARTTVTSLWDVDSAATKELMIRFYENLYHADPSKRAPSRIEALRRAQLDLLHNPQFSRGGDDELADSDRLKRLSPKYWAAWVLSGDWR
jgi:CHAT domain-containing protein/tetratricopeptide (TPR) repeat protein